MLAARRSALAGGRTLASVPSVRCVQPQRVSSVVVQAKKTPKKRKAPKNSGKTDKITGKKRLKGNQVCFSNKKSRKFQEPNLHRKKLWWEAGKRFVKIKISAKTLRTINKNGLEAVAKEHDINLSALPYVDCSEARIQWKASQPKRPPMAKKPRKMKNPEKLAKSKKTPKIAEYVAGKIKYTRSDPADLPAP